MIGSTRTHTFRRIAALVAVATLSAVAMVSAPMEASAAKKTTKKKTTKPKGKKVALKSSLTWRLCDDPLFQCSELNVPVDAANPAGGSLTLSLVKRPLAAGVEKYGTLITGDGFPGFSGVPTMKADVRSKVFASGLAHYDVIAFEHRGVGNSSPLACATKATDLGFDAFASFDTDLKFDELLNAWRTNCFNKNPSLMSHMGISDSVNDLEAIRVALGEEQLSFQVWDHDATIAASYAARFPTRVRASALFNPYPMADDDEFLLDQAVSVDAAINRFLQACQAAPTCPLASGAGAGARFDSLVLSLLRKPLAAGPKPEDGTIGGDSVTALVVAALDDETLWPDTIAAIVALEKSDPTLYNQLDTAGAPLVAPLAKSGAAFWAIACQDGLYLRGDTIDMLLTVAPRATAHFAFFSDLCVNWPVAKARPPEASFRSNAKTVIFSNRRSGNPTQWGQNAQRLIAGSVLVPLGGGSSGDGCLERILTPFLESLTLPAPNSAC